MSSPYFLAGAAVEVEAPRPPRPQIPRLSLESLDGLISIPLNGTQGFIRMPGSTGLRMPPVEVVSTTIPGVPGSVLTDVRTNERPIFIPIYLGTDGDIVGFRNKLAALYALVDPNGRRTFKLVGESASGNREMVVTYVGGLEGADDAMTEGLSWAKFGLNLVAHEPYARARVDRTIEFHYEPGAKPFLGVVGGTDTPWPRTLSTSTAIGENMSVTVASEVEVYPTIELHGPMTSFHGDLTHASSGEGAEPDWLIDISAGVASGSMMRIVTDPRRKSFRYNGALAAGRVALGSRLGPFRPGENLLNVAAPGISESTIIRLSWREQFRSLW